jgi:NTE family protein
MAMKRALVLGGGGVIGVAWESGLVTGLREAGVDLMKLDTIVGTSAGALVGVQISSGRVPPNPGVPRQTEQPRRATSEPPIDRAKLDVAALGAIFSLWGKMKETSLEQVIAIGKIVRGLDRSTAEQWIGHISGAVEVTEWPAPRLLVVAVDTESGTRRVFDKDSGVPLQRALAASATVPGLFPLVEIEGRLYMDGQVHSSTNADLLLSHAPEQVLIAMPTNALTARGIGAHAERMLELETAALRAAGASVSIKTPTAADAERMGPNLMDGARAADAYAIGLDTGRAWAGEL